MKTEKLTKAERIFKETRWECKKHIKDWGYEVNPDGTSIGFSGLIYRDNEAIYARTINAVEKILIERRKRVNMMAKIKVMTEEEVEKENQILNMVESTLKNSRRNIKQF